jgi:hypothetical protein
LLQASRAQVLAVLTEELGHHLDGLLNSVDSPGDEGEMFAALLSRAGAVSSERRAAILLDHDNGSVWVTGRRIEIEKSSRVVSTPIPAINFMQTSYENFNGGSFSVLRSDGSVVSWGDGFLGGHSSHIDFDGPSNNLTVSKISTTSDAFATLLSNGSVVTWGDFQNFSASGNSSGVDFDGPSNNLTVTRIYSNSGAFAALRSDGSVVTLGFHFSGGDSSGVDFEYPFIHSQCVPSPPW